MNTPELITALNPNEIFVFGSNVDGIHAGGAARIAYEHFGAEWGAGEGLQGRSYAIPTMEGLPSLSAAVARFIEFATACPSLRFWVTKIGTGIAGHTIAEIAPLFNDAPPNVTLPHEFETRA